MFSRWVGTTWRRRLGSREFFDSYSDAFDRIYSDRKGRVQSWIDRRFRWSMAERHALALDRLSRLARGRRVLDIGCGSGRYSIALARAGAVEVVGVDEAPSMIRVAREAATASGASACRFVESEFFSYKMETPFDFALCVGVFDYVLDPLPFLQHIRSMVRQELIASFPVRWHWLTPQRKLRYILRNCPIRFYSENDVRSLLPPSGFSMVECRRIDRDYFVVARTT